MTDDQDGSRRPPVDGPTVMGPSTGHLHGPAPEEPTHPDKPATDEEPTLAAPGATPPDEATLRDPAPPPATFPEGPTTVTPNDEATLRAPDDPTVATPVEEATLRDPADSAPPRALPDGPTVASPIDEATVRDPGSTPPTTFPDGPTVATPVDDTTLPEPTQPPPTTWPYDPTANTPVDSSPDEPTAAVVDESPTTTGPTVASWPLDELLPPPPTDLIWRPDPPEPPPRPRRPAYYVALGAAVVLVVALGAAAALATVVRPTRQVAGSARPAQTIPEITTRSTEAPPTTTTTEPQDGPADHPLSTATARMADVTCALPRFDLPDDAQAAFYTAAKTCADDAWHGVLAEAGLEGRVEVVTVTAPVRTGSCGEITPDSPATQCDGTVYMTPAHLRDTERNGRYPGRYFGVFLREYARALQVTTGLAESAADVDGAEERLAQQATCMAGIASGAMANRGAVDANITGEIADRLSDVDAPPDAKAWLDKGFQARTLDACNTWT